VVKSIQKWKNTMKNITSLLIMASTLAITMSACSLKEPLGAESNDYTSASLALISESINAFPMDTLSEEESAGLLLMREEEKLARDVYIHLYSSWNMRIFNNISDSEATHMSAILMLLQRYGLEDPVEEDVIGTFKNETLQSLYTALCVQGDSSLMGALEVGATIEDLDIMDLMELSAEVDNEDIRFVYESLTKGSRNHIRSFSSLLQNYGQVYEAQFIEQALLDSILSTSKETGNW